MSRFLMGALLVLSSQAFAEKFTLTSPSIKEGQTLSLDQVFNSFGCSGKNISPPLAGAIHLRAPKVMPLPFTTPMPPQAPVGGTGWCITCPHPAPV